MFVHTDGLPEAEARFLNLVAKVYARVPFDTYIICDAYSNSRGGVSSRMLADNMPEEFRRRYFASSGCERDPLILVTRAARAPVRTADVRAAAAADPRLMPCLMAAAEALGAAAVAIPLRFRGRLSGEVVFRRHGAEFTDAEVEYCELVAPALHLAATELPAAVADDLTPRERECLAWTSVGKTAWEIGSILGISEHTAVAHLNGAVRKLRAASRAQAVAEALRRGLID